MTKICVNSIPCSCNKGYRDETCHPLNVRLEEHRKAVCQGEMGKSSKADSIWKEKGNHLPLWNEVKMTDREERWRIRCLKEVAHMLATEPVGQTNNQKG